MKIFKEPLFHFVLLGGLLFVIYAWTNGREGGVERDRRIVISEGRIAQLSQIFNKTWQRPPTAEELKGLIDDFILEEIYYRQAMAMGLDQNDTLIRRRLRQKMEFLTDDAVALLEPSDAELQEYLNTYAEKFRSEPVYTFRQVYFNPELHGEDPMSWARLRADELRAGGEVLGDRTLLEEVYREVGAREIDATFGRGFAKKLEQLPLGEWSDPVPSGLGLHLIVVEKFVPGRVPRLDEARNLVQREWSHQKRLELRKKFNQDLLREYEIVIDWESKEESVSGLESDLTQKEG